MKIQNTFSKISDSLEPGEKPPNLHFEQINARWSINPSLKILF